MTKSDMIAVEVACATPAKQRIVQLQLDAGATARQAVIASGLQAEFPGLDFAELTLGIFGEVVADERVLQPGERVEIYRPLLHEPREARRLQATRARVQSASRVRTPVQRS